MIARFNTTEVRDLVRMATQRTGRPVFDDDLIQEAVARALDAFRRTDRVENPRAFLAKIVFDTVHDYWRRRRPAEDIESIDERFLCVQPHLEVEMDRYRRTSQLQAALGMLEESKRKLVRLFYEDEISVPEIARLERMSESAVKMRLMRIRKELKGHMDKEGKKEKRNDRVIPH